MHVRGDHSVPAASDGPIEVRCVGDDPEYLDRIATLLTDREGFDARVETEPGAALAAVDRIDCVVGGSEALDTDGLELLGDVRSRAPTLPFVFVTGSDYDELAERLSEDLWTEALRKGDPTATAPVLVGRVRRLVAHDRTHRAADRCLAAVEATGDAVAVVDPDGTLAFVTSVFAGQFGTDPDDLVGRPWRTCFPDGEVGRLESTALQTVRDGWQWTGGCVCRADGGDTFTAQTRVVGLDDGSFVLCLTGVEDE